MAATNKSTKGNSGGNSRAKTNKNTKTSNSNNKKQQSKVDNTYTRGRKSAAKAALVEEDNSRKNEIYLFVYLAVAVFLLCSNFGWCGVVGDFISNIVFGLLGTVSYILPVYLFFSAAFLLSNGAQKKIVKRVLCAAIFMIVAAFIFQLIGGVDEVTVKSLYQTGAEHKMGGGVIFGGILALLYKLIGFTGSIIVITLLTIIGIIVVLDVSLIDMIKSQFNKEYDEDGDYQDEFQFDEPVRRHRSDNMLESIKVLESEDKKHKNKKQKNKVVDSEEVHELKPLTQDEVVPNDTPKTDAPADFFERPEFKTEFAVGSNDALESAAQETVLAPVKRRRKKTKESYNEMVAERDNIAENINGASATSGSMISEQESVDVKNSQDLEETMEYADKVSAKVSVKTSSKQEMNSGTESGLTSQLQADNADISAEINDAEIGKEYQFPPIELLRSGNGKGGNSSEQGVRETAMKLKSTLENFGVKVTITDYSCGPSVTRYELQPEQGVKVSKIVNLADDIKLNLAAADIRIEAPIPGKAAIGIEVPNKESSPVFFRDLLESDNFKKFSSNIAFAVGKDISGQVIVADIAKMPHLLVAGATGSGKSVCINTLIMSILYKANPNDVKLIMVDPKQVELSIYNGIPHMLIPVVTDPKKAAGALNWAVMEMTNRYQLFAQYNVRNLQGYNEKVKAVTGLEEGNEELKKLPQIIIIVDELADLMMVAHGEVEDAIVRLSQLARAAGIHLVIATQRPSVDVITGLIKANVPSRIAMTVSSGVDSRTILDMNGAEKLLGKGDMLFYPTGYPKPVRVQGAFLSDDEIAGVVEFLKAQNGETAYDEKISQEIASTKVGSGSASGGSDSDVDEYFVDAGKFIIGKDKASIGMLQRVYKIGFNRAARIMDQLSDAGVVGPEEGTKPRKVLMSMEEFENYVEEYL